MKSNRLKHVLAAAFAWFLLPALTVAQDNPGSREYTAEHPLVYEDAADLWPYCYLNEYGEPEGYNVDLVSALCQIAKIPYVIQLKPTQQAVVDLREGRSDLMLGLDNRNEEAGLKIGKTAVLLFTHSVVHVKGASDYVKSVDDLSRQKTVVHAGSYCHYLMQNKGWGDNALPMHDMKAAIKNLSTEGEGQIVWNTLSLKWLMRKYQTSNLVMTPVEMPHGTYRFMSGDSVLLGRLDAAYKVLIMDDSRVDEMRKRWLYPELKESGIPSWVWHLAGGVGCLALVLLFFNISYRYRESRMSSLIRKETSRLSHILSMSNMHVWTFNVATRTFRWTGTRQQTEHRQTALEFSHCCSTTDFERICDVMRRLVSGEQEQATIEMMATTPFDGSKQQHEYSVVLSVLRRKGGVPTDILGTMSDITQERERQRQAKTLLSRYRSIFENAMVDMVLYDHEGYIVMMNNRAQRTFGMTSERARELRANLQTAFDGDGSLDLNTFTHFHVTRKLKTINSFLPEEGQPKNVYYELQLVPVRDKEQHLMGIYGTGLDTTGFVNLWKQQKENILRLNKANSEVSTYIKNIDYVMKVGGVRVASYSPHTHVLTILRETNVVQHTLTQTRCLMLLADGSKKRALKLFDSMDHLTEQPLTVEVQTIFRTKGHDLFLEANFLPVRNASGQVDSYFGLCRDVTEIKATEEQLARESVRAREVEELKNSFLRNMSYEIRTPLNAVVGFAELFEREHQQADESVFVAQIKDNAAYLLHLINDILFLSRLDAHMIELSHQPVDFSQTFQTHCYAGWIHERREGVRYEVYNHFDKLVVDIDDTNVGRIIGQVTANAAQHTTSGQVRTRYDYFDGKLMIAVEDTGCGISEEALKHVFERFNGSGNGGTGLGLPICRELAQQMGGRIDISSVEGRGTTVWIVIPCKLLAMERKKENYTTA